jgi:cellulase
MIFSTLSLLGFITSASAHGYLKSISVNGGANYLAWQVGQDDYVTPEPTRYARRIRDNGPVPDFTSTNITCNVGGNLPAKGVIPVMPGDKVYVPHVYPFKKIPYQHAMYFDLQD